MAVTDYRPWGAAQWVFGKLGQKPWTFMGCIGTEERSMGAWQHVAVPLGIKTARMLRITDLASRHSGRCASLLADRTTTYQNLGGATGGIIDRRINDPLSLIKDAHDSFAAVSGPHVILDVTSLPKRFFFPIIRFLLRRPAVELSNLIVTYTVPAEYTKEKLAENVDEWDCIPTFIGGTTNDSGKLLAVAVGFEGLGLHEHFDLSQSGRPIKLLLPFPAAPSSFKRSWDLLHRLRKLRHEELFETHRVDSKDVSDTFNRLVALSRGNTLSIDLAPFGPKPTSLGMCLYAASTNSKVYYTQPGVYHPDYSMGISTVGGMPEIYAYCLRLDGRDLYSV